jgi:aspartyl/asparaginyl-tRNA synthetase
MEFTKEGMLKVGSTTLATPVKIRIPDYGYELPEIHSSSPIPLPMYNPVAHIINWLERGINIEFCTKEDADKVFFFIIEYNRFAEAENKNIENVDDQYKLAIKAQEKLFKMIDYKNYIEKKKADGDIPFKHSQHLFKGIKKRSSEQVSTSYKSPFIKNRKDGAKKKQFYTPPSPDEIFAYDIFSPSPDINVIENDMYKDVDLR